MLIKILKWLEKYFEEALCTICLAMMSTCVMLQVVLRIVFDNAVPWAEEIAVYSMVFAVYLGASLAVREGAHIRVMLLVNLFPKKVQKACLIVADIIWFAFIILMIFQSVVYMELLFETTFISPGLGIEQRWFQLVVPFSLILIALRLIQHHVCPPKDVSNKEVLV
ncbi:MAG: TRAP transporter small permease [Arenicella sp.]